MAPDLRSPSACERSSLQGAATRATNGWLDLVQSYFLRRRPRVQTVLCHRPRQQVCFEPHRSPKKGPKPATSLRARFRLEIWMSAEPSSVANVCFWPISASQVGTDDFDLAVADYPAKQRCDLTLTSRATESLCLSREAWPAEGAVLAGFDGATSRPAAACASCCPQEALIAPVGTMRCAWSPVRRCEAQMAP